MTATIVNLLLALFLLAANAFYVAAEFALVKSKGFRINAMAEQNRFGARLLKKIVGNIEAYLACCQLGITMASLGLGWIGEPTVSAFLWPVLVPLGMPESALHFTSFLIGFLIFSSLHIVVGEQVPKTLAIREPVPVSQWIAYPLHASFVLLYPLSWILNTASRSILRVLGVRESSTHEILTDVEIEQLVEESAEHGNIEEGQAEFIQNVFRFGELVVSDVMIHRTEMITVCLDEAPDKVTRAVLEASRTRVPLWSGRPENIVGILHVKDLFRAIQVAQGDITNVDVRAIAGRPGSCRMSALFPSRSRRSADTRRRSRSWSTSTAR
jgi:CBS domain containing-hemolysin-like protein